MWRDGGQRSQLRPLNVVAEGGIEKISPIKDAKSALLIDILKNY
jgi:hypothetical protein